MSKSKIRNMEEFAAVSGISRPTVSKYFHDPDSVRQSTRRRIEEALEKHDYRPNIFAINQNHTQPTPRLFDSIRYTPRSFVIEARW